MNLPDPSGPPIPVTPGNRIIMLIKRCTFAVVSGGMFLLVAAAIFTPTMGGRRSTRLKWQERQQQADEAVAKTIQAEHPEPQHE
jgi:hypothetical protein